VSRASELVASLTLAQQAALLSGADDWHTCAIPEVGLPAVELGDGPHGLRTETGVDMVWVPSTGFPTGSALGATWDADVVARVAAAIGEEARAMGVQLVLGPGVNMKRTPLCGRNFEYFAEDPVLAGDLAAAYIRGIQGVGVGACLKHYAANNQETDRTEISVEVDEGALRAVYLEAFRRAIVAADPWAVMCSYNRIGGVHASQHRWLLTDVLRDEWGYRGLVVSDWDAVHDPVAAVAAGLDLEMPGTGGRSAAALVAAVTDGRLAQAAVEQAATRVVEFVERCLPDGPAAGPVRDAGIVPGERLRPEQRVALGADAHHDLAREAAAAAATLLRNPAGVLPLDPDGTQRIGVVGGYARVPRIQGGGSSGVWPVQVDEPLAAIGEVAGDRVRFAQGYPVPATDFYQETAPAPEADLVALRAEAVALARDCDVVVAFAGLPLSAEVEAADRDTLALPPEQVDLLAALAATGTPLVVVLAAGSAVDLAPWHDDAAAILLTWLGGQAVGSATADVLFGLAEPGGRLGETYPLRLADTPGHGTFPGEGGRIEYAEGPLIGYRWYDAEGLDVRYPFGHGLSYTTFEYTGASVRDAADDEVEVAVTVTNTGGRSGSEVVQLYVQRPAPEPGQPVRELRAFAKVSLAPGESAVVELRLGVRDFAVVDVPGRCWRQPAGTHRIVLASSSRQPRIVLPIDRRSGRLSPLAPLADLSESQPATAG
jgi:beta-glucosidase